MSQAGRTGRKTDAMKNARIAALASLLCFSAPISAFADAGAAEAPADLGASESVTRDAPSDPPKLPESGESATEPALPGSDTATAEPADPLKLGAEIYSRIRSGEWLPAFAALLMLLIWAVRRFGGKLVPALNSKLGGYLVGVGTAFAVTLAAWASSGEPFSFGVLTGALGAAWAASGGYDTIRDMLKSKASA